MPARTRVSRERLLAVAAPGGPVYTHWLALMARIDANAKAKLSGDMLNVRTGNLRSSQAPPAIVFNGVMIRGVLRNTASYAAALHQGSSPHDIYPVNKKVLRFTPAGAGAPIFRPMAHHPGTTARPWLRRAAEEVTGRASRIQ